jgi:hypothetical protein
MIRPSSGFAGLDYLALLLVAVAGAAYWLTLGDGVGWGGGDFASYVWNARNLLEGRALGDAPFIPNYEANTGVTVVPPLFPLALAAPVALFGPDLHVLKLYNLGFLLAFFFLSFRYARTELRGVAIFFLLALAASPQLWAMRDALLSEYLFLLLLMALLISWERLYHPVEGSLDNAGSRSAMVSILAAAAILTRVVGVVLVPAVFLAGIWTERRLSLRTLAITASAAGAFAYLVLSIGIFEQYTPSFSHAAMDDAGQSPIGAGQAQGLADSLLATLQLIPERLRFAFGQVSVLWTRGIQDDPGAAAGWPAQYQRAVTALLLVLGAAGFLARAIRRATLAEWLTLGYGSMMLLIPAYLSSGRMYLPVAVMLVFYAFYATAVLGRLLPGGIRWTPPATLLCLILVSDALSFQAIDKQPLAQGSADPLAVEFFDAVRRTVPEDAVMIGYRPRGVAFFTNRTTTDYHQTSADADFWGRAARIGASYLYFDTADPRTRQSGTAPDDPRQSLSRYAAEFMDDSGVRFDPVFENERFRLYKLTR